METALVTRSTVITLPNDIVRIREDWVKSKQAELEMARMALARLDESGATPRRLQTVRERISLLRRVVKALEGGFVPIPRFSSTKLRLDQEDLPLKAIIAVNEAQAQKVFDEFRIVLGQEGSSRQGPYGRIARRDPIIVGVVRTPEHSHVESPNTLWRSVVVDVPGFEEHFLVAWWRPEDQWSQDSF